MTRYMGDEQLLDCVGCLGDGKDRVASFLCHYCLYIMYLPSLAIPVVSSSFMSSITHPPSVRPPSTSIQALPSSPRRRLDLAVPSWPDVSPSTSFQTPLDSRGIEEDLIRGKIKSTRRK